MAYTVLARRYRSNAFDELIGQETIARTLLNAIATGRVAHAYLFTGTRGVGKTSMARLFARALNAPDTLPQCPKPKGVSFPPADVQQRMAQAIMVGQDMNVIEIDGASNNSVDQARELNANAGLTPTGNAQYKVYIIDEVHMLSTPAFNALLKTMEEPPSHVKFVLCTTEAQKLPETIRSRCQRFDFRNIPAKLIQQHLAQVVRREQVPADEAALQHLALLGNGSMRDALSLLDRLIATADPGQPLSVQLIERMLGLPDGQQITAMIDAMAQGDARRVLEAAAALIAKGVGADQLVGSLVERLRQLMLIRACGAQSELVELPDDARDAAQTQAQRFDTAGLVHMIALCESLQRNAKGSANPRALLEATLVRLALAEKMADVTALLAGKAPSPDTAEKKKPLPPEVLNARPAHRELAIAPAAPSTPSASPTELWPALLAGAAQRAPLSWVQNLTFRGFDGRTLKVAPAAGNRELTHFLTPARLDQLAQLAGSVLSQPVRVELDAPTTPPPEASPAVAAQPTSNSRQEAMSLPLVRQVQELFDTTVVDIRNESNA